VTPTSKKLGDKSGVNKDGQLELSQPTKRLSSDCT
jgi:hypothetical protein